MLSNAFNAILRIHRRSMTLKRRGTDPLQSVTIYATPTNYFRSQAGPSQMEIEGRQFIISAKNFPTYPGGIKRGDFLVDSVYGAMAINDIEEMLDLGGSVMGWRVRTS